MVLKRLFANGKAPAANTNNEPGGLAYALSPEHALAQMAVTGTMHNTFYATAEQQRGAILALAAKVSPGFVARTAVYCRERGFMKDVPALLVAYLAKHDVGLMKAVFPRVVDNGKMLRNFVQIVRSGAVDAGRSARRRSALRRPGSRAARPRPSSATPWARSRRWPTSSSWSVPPRRRATARRTRSARRSTATSSARPWTPSSSRPS